MPSRRIQDGDQCSGKVEGRWGKYDEFNSDGDEQAETQSQELMCLETAAVVTGTRMQRVG